MSIQDEIVVFRNKDKSLKCMFDDDRRCMYVIAFGSIVVPYGSRQVRLCKRHMKGLRTLLGNLRTVPIYEEYLASKIAIIKKRIARRNKVQRKQYNS